jgi:hypothetical protein
MKVETAALVESLMRLPSVGSPSAKHRELSRRLETKRVERDGRKVIPESLRGACDIACHKGERQ